MTDFPVWQVIVFLLMDFIILASVVAGAFFLFLYIRTRKYEGMRVTDLNELEAFKNKNLQMETDASIESNKPVAPSTIQQSYGKMNGEGGYVPPARIHNQETQKMFNCQMQQNEQQMHDTFVVEQQLNSDANTNYLNM